jgi:hypothetical protein
MRSLKRRTRYLHKLQYRICLDSENPQGKKSRWGVRRFGKQNVSSWEPWGSKLWRKKFYYQCKKDWKAVEAGVKDLQSGYIEDCRYHPCRITNINPDPKYGRLDVNCESLISGKSNSCSYFHCGIVSLTEEEAFARRDFAVKYGMTPYQYEYVVDASGVDREELIMKIRWDKGMDLIWEFNKNGGSIPITDEGRAWMNAKFGVDYDALEPMTEEEMMTVRNP